METKICNKCEIEKSINEFRKSYHKKQNKFYIRNECIECQKEYSRNNAKKYYNSQHGKEKQKEYLRINREKILEKNRIRTSMYRKTHKEEIKKKNKIYNEKNKERINKRYRERYQNDYIYKFKNTVRNSIRMSFKRKGMLKIKLAEEILGCNIDFFVMYLIKTYEKKYNEKWKWEFLDNVHIDHKKPLAKAQTEEEVIKLCHYTNLQLLKAEDNLKKGSKELIEYGNL